MNPILILREAMKKIPVLKYALGVAGMGAVIAIIDRFKIGDAKIPWIAILILFGFMILLLVFSSFLKSKDPYLRVAGYILIYTTLIIVCTVSILFVTSAFFDWPTTTGQLIK